MAIMHRSAHSLRGAGNAYILKSVLCLVLIAFYVYGRAQYVTMPQCPDAIAAFISAFGFFYYKKKAALFYAGAEGERTVRKALARLPDSYHVFPNYEIKTPDGRDEADFVVIGETGVFVIEVKNYAGTISGDDSDEVWRQKKRGGSARRIPNLARQTRRHAANVRMLLEREQLRCRVKGVLVFPHKNVRIEAGPLDLFVVFDARRAVEWILNETRHCEEDWVDAVVRCMASAR